MGWLDGLFGGGSSNGSGGSSSSDPLAKLDPKLREFLEKESPLKYQSATDQQQKQQQQQKQTQEEASLAQQKAPAQAQAQSQAQQTSSSTVPAQSLYQDGRYADIWKTYRPLTSIEADTKSDHERLMDVLDAYKDRRAQIGRAALENCAVEQIDWNECIKTGPLSSRMTMCHAEMKKFERCYNVQSRLLKGLGYLSAYDRSPEVDERIQMHADTLYQRMLEQEAIMEKAKEEGRPVPEIDLSNPAALRTKEAATATAAPVPSVAAVLAAETKAATAASSVSAPTSEIPKELRKQWDEKLAKLPETERFSEEAALRAELDAHNELSARVAELRAVQAAEREQRKADGKATIKDRVSGLFGH